jgi:hypothetical protein
LPFILGIDEVPLLFTVSLSNRGFTWYWHQPPERACHGTVLRHKWKLK